MAYFLETMKWFGKKKGTVGWKEGLSLTRPTKCTDCHTCRVLVTAHSTKFSDNFLGNLCDEFLVQNNSARIYDNRLVCLVCSHTKHIAIRFRLTSR